MFSFDVPEFKSKNITEIPLEPCTDNQLYYWSPNYKLIDIISLHGYKIDQYKSMRYLQQVKVSINDIYFSYKLFDIKFCRGPKYNPYDVDSVYTYTPEPEELVLSPSLIIK
ncbi:hypothetical protein TVAG_348740 [Trichomonas vaginalis G3]|uniref:Uncharacterized protein n=1 Tax=Trichomonas vaginalis (strain ATCC PRA-98 / G3) TaxID=412133 RepID=A2G3N9_TRIV3|nr:hypothetical protein TVAGG3_0756590 [Trichomonas vaginalis G3]EAX88232.1 hypothetical protein TVAG_348740 [Trichomonas vaginalis G3]KAI5512909.1 hypothetical protein TVAGG3_0756590 [Trichomonas vaginalis G3]|eukprot:XP_001301162.1 hypothetical protein [Trichomonas vaginalis G3]